MTEDQLKAIEDRFAKGGFSNWDFEKLIAALREARESFLSCRDDLTAVRKELYLLRGGK